MTASDLIDAPTVRNHIDNGARLARRTYDFRNFGAAHQCGLHCGLGDRTDGRAKLAGGMIR